jgi:hypothetical protein
MFLEYSNHPDEKRGWIEVIVNLILCYMRNLLLLFSVFIILSGCSSSSNEFCKAVSDFKENTGNITSFYFYNSTLRMVNFTHDPSYDKLISDVKKIRVLTLKNEKEDLDQKRMIALANQIHKESFVDMMQMKQQGYTIMVFMKKHNDQPIEFIGMGYDLKSCFIVDLLGSIPVSVLPSLINGNFKMAGLNSVLNFKAPENSEKSHKHKNDHGDNPGDK